MFLELSDILVCPRCRPAQGLVVMVEELENEYVTAGALGCPECEARFPVRRGLILFGPARERRRPAGEAAVPPGAGEEVPPNDGRPGEGEVPAGCDGPRPRLEEARLFEGVSAGEAAGRLAALLGLPDPAGPLLLGEGMAPLGKTLARRVAGVDVLVLEGPAGAEEGGAPLPAGARGAPRGRRAAPGEQDDGVGEGSRLTALAGVGTAGLPFFGGRLGGVALLSPLVPEVEEAVRVLASGGRLVVVEPGREARRAAAGSGLEVVADDERAVVAVRQ